MQRQFQPWDAVSVEWLDSPSARVLFFVSTVFVLAVTYIVFIMELDPAQLSWFVKGLAGTLGVLGALAMFVLWVGMWRYWAHKDQSGRWSKRLWFTVMLFGFWYGSCVYCWFVYLPQTTERTRGS